MTHWNRLFIAACVTVCLSYVTGGNKWLGASDVPKWTPHDAVFHASPAAHNPFTGTRTPAGAAEGGAVRSFKAPFGGDAVLYLRGER